MQCDDKPTRRTRANRTAPARIVTMIAACLLTTLCIPTSRFATAGELDCDNNGVPDAEELSGNDCNGNLRLDVCENETWSAVADLSGFLSIPSASLYGGNVDIDGGWAAVGQPRAAAPETNDGQVVMYRYSPSMGWHHHQTIDTPEPAASLSFFGDQVVVRGDRMFATCPSRSFESQSRGAVYCYRLIGETWELRETIISPYRDANFPRQIVVEGNRLFVFANKQSPALFFPPRIIVYRLDETEWVIEQEIQVSNPGINNGGRSEVFAVDNDVLVTSESQNFPLLDNMYLFNLHIRERSNRQWNSVARMDTNVVFNSGYSLGPTSLTVVGDTIVAAYGSQGGRLFIVEKSSGTWTRRFVSDVNTADWAMPLGDGYLVGRNLPTPQARHLTLDGDTPIWTDRPDLAGVGGPWSRSGNWLAFIAAQSGPLVPRIGELAGDCDGDSLLDACELAGGAADFDRDLRPDDCQLDCNADGIPDVAQLVGKDCDHNGILDECDADPLDPDGDGAVASDCNGNGIIDACEPDLDENGVPDDCDLDPGDPDGDGFVAADCNENGIDDAREIVNDFRHVATIWPPFDPRFFQFGASVAIDGDILVIGAPRLSIVSPSDERVYIYRRVWGQWTLDQILMVDSSIPSVRRFGEKVLVDGDLILVGAETGTNTATIFTYQFDNGSWQSRTRLNYASGNQVNHEFNIESGLLTVGSSDDYVKLYDFDGEQWVELDRFYGGGSTGGDSVLVGDRLFVRARTNFVTVFRRNGDAWEFETELDSHDPDSVPANDSRPIIANADRVALAKPGAKMPLHPYRPNAGTVDVFAFINGHWFLESTLIGQSIGQFGQGGQFGASLAFCGDRLAVGEPLAGNGIGEVQLFERQGGEWRLKRTIPSPSTMRLGFGASMDVSGETLVVAAPDGHLSGTDADSADVVYIYETDLDIDNNGVLDSCEDDCNGNQIPDDVELAGVSAPQYALVLLSGTTHCVFDANNDGALNGLDIPYYIEIVVSGP